MIVAILLATASCEVHESCTDDGLLGPDGESYGPDPKQDCQLVDDNGNVVEEAP